MKILVALDDSQFSIAVTELRAVEVRTQGRHVRLLHVLKSYPSPFAEAVGSRTDPDLVAAQAEQREQAEHLLHHARHKLRTAGLDARTTVQHGDVRGLIRDEAERWHADFVVVGSHGRNGLARLLMGGVSDAVAHRVRCSVEIVGVRPSLHLRRERPR